MNQPIVQSTAGVTLVGGGPVPARDLKAALARAPLAVAADSGADRLLAAGILPQAVIGDFDSISAAARATLPAARLHPMEDQDSTDFEKALAAIGAPFVLAVGFSGARMDHGLAVMNALVRLQDRPCIVIGPKDIAFAAPPRLSIRLRPGDAFSLFPLAPVRGESQGLHWPLDGIAFAPDGMIATMPGPERSSRTSGAVTRFEVAILPRSRLDQAIQAIKAPPPAPPPHGPDVPAAHGG